MLILDTHAEVFVWVGQSVDSKEKQKVFEISQMYIELATTTEGLSQDVPLYKVAEGNEPCFFTTYFSWDSTKATAQGNSFEKKLLWLFGTTIHALEGHDKSNGSSHSGPTQRASALAAFSSAFTPSSGTKTSAPKPSSSSQGSQRAAAVAALSSVLTAEQKKGGDASPTRVSRSPSADPSDRTKGDSSPMVEDTQEVSDDKETIQGGGSPSGSESNGEDLTPKEALPSDENGGESTFSYERVKAKSNPASGIDYKRREAYLFDAKFESLLGMTKEAFY
ncbi:villin-2-like [Magnolia sinica]|uniref:villin-2-like n=1 Tax=Magnolia sinica TaxID=86752 RepID=UPI00265A8154|nr:villin-2-like [Magnolia sinica]